MARGWESKSVEQQQEERLEQGKATRTLVSPEQQEHNRKREGWLLARNRLLHELAAARNPRYRQMLTDSLTEVDRQLASFK